MEIKQIAGVGNELYGLDKNGTLYKLYYGIRKPEWRLIING